MQRVLTVPPSQEDVARAAAEISGGALAGVHVETWPRGRSHHAYVLTAPSGAQFLFKVHRRPHAGRMRRFLPLAEPPPPKRGPPPAGRLADVQRRPPRRPLHNPDFFNRQDTPP